MARHLIFGLPATAALVALVLMALTPHAARSRRQRDAARRDRAPRGDRGGTAPVAEDGGGRPPDRRHRARLQQSAHRHHRQSRSRAAPARRARSRVRGWLANSRQASERAATLVQRLLAFSRQHPLEVKSVDINRLVQEMSELLGRTIGETVTIETVLAGGLWNAAVDPNQLENAIPQSRRQCARRDGRRRTAHHRDRQRSSRRDTMSSRLPAPRSRPGQYVMVAVSDYRQRHVARGNEPRVRAVLHHQADRRRHRPRAVARSTAS